MSPAKLSLAVALVFASSVAIAAPVTVNLLSGGTQSGNAYNNQSAGWCTGTATSVGVNLGTCAGGGTNYGNAYNYSGIGSGVGTLKMSAFGGVYDGNTTNPVNDVIGKAWVGNYTPNGFGITSQNVNELVQTGSGPNTWADNSGGTSPQHTVDNVSNYESMLFSFGSQVMLDSVQIGFGGTGASSGNTLDADATVLVYNGGGDPTASIAGKTYDQLLASGWVLAGNIFDMKQGQSNTMTASGNSYSKSAYWMIGAYMAIGSNVGATFGGKVDSTLDSFKISGISVSTPVTGNAIPEPDSVALFGIAALGLFLARRKARKA